MTINWTELMQDRPDNRPTTFKVKVSEYIAHIWHYNVPGLTVKGNGREIQSPFTIMYEGGHDPTADRLVVEGLVTADEVRAEMLSIQAQWAKKEEEHEIFRAKEAEITNRLNLETDPQKQASIREELVAARKAHYRCDDQVYEKLFV